MKAWQRKVREAKSIEAPSVDLFGSIDAPIDPDISTAVVRAVDHAIAVKIIEEYEWLGRMPIKVWFTFGIFFQGVCGGVVAYGPDYVEHFGVWEQVRVHRKANCACPWGLRSLGAAPCRVETNSAIL